MPGCDITELRERGIEEVDVDIAAEAGLAGAENGADHPQRSADSAVQIDEREAGFLGWTSGLAGDAHPAGVALHQVVIAGFGGAFASATESREGAADQSRFEGFERGIVEAEFLRQIAAEIVEDGVRGLS